MVPDAPVTFSMITGTPSDVRIASLRLRARVSTGPPAPNGTIRVTGCDGYGCAVATPANAKCAIAKPRNVFLISIPHLIAPVRQIMIPGSLHPSVEHHERTNRTAK